LARGGAEGVCPPAVAFLLPPPPPPRRIRIVFGRATELCDESRPTRHVGSGPFNEHDDERSGRPAVQVMHE